MEISDLCSVSEEVRLVLKGVNQWNSVCMQILRNTKILFSRLWHVGEKAENQPYWVLALQLGAECTTTLDESVTHVVTNTKFTEKASIQPIVVVLCQS